MKRATSKGAKVGAIAGALSATVYAVFFLVAAELLLPIPETSVTVIFTLEGMKFILPELLGSSIVWLFLPMLIGAITGAGFEFIFKKFKLSYKAYLLVCTLICAVISVAVSTLTLVGFISSYNNPLDFFSVLLWNGHLQNSVIVTAGLIIVPSVIYVAVGFIVSRSLYKTLSQSTNVQTPSP